MKPNDSITKLFESIFPKRQAKRVTKRLCTVFGITTIQQFYSVLNPFLRVLSNRQIKVKGLNKKYNNIRSRCQSKDVKIRKIQKSCSIWKKDAEKVWQALSRIKFPSLLENSPKSALSLGCLPEKQKHIQGIKRFHSRLFRKLPNKLILPGYNKDNVFDQGRRGTCVSMAISKLIDYLSGLLTSKQFLYHQSKMIDGIIDMEGTYISTGFRVLSEEDLIDFGTVSEDDWNYNGKIKSTKHQGPPPEKCYNTMRMIGFDPLQIEDINIVYEIKSILAGDNGSRPSGVVVGLEVYESFENPHSNQTGIITLPLPGESCVGNHAMLIVGYDDKDQRFLVVNSWGKQWAFQNPKGYSGHALIPYQYIEKYCHSAFSMSAIGEQKICIDIDDRLSYGQYPPRKKRKVKAKIPFYINVMYKYSIAASIIIALLWSISLYFNYPHTF